MGQTESAFMFQDRELGGGRYRWRHRVNYEGELRGLFRALSQKNVGVELGGPLLRCVGSGSTLKNVIWA